MGRIAALALVFLIAGGSAAAAERVLTFADRGQVVRRLDLDALRAASHVRRVEVDDPFYGRKVVFLALPLADVFTAGFGKPPGAFAGENFFLRALDGYARPASAERLAEPGAYLAFADAEHAQGDDPGWQPIDRRQVDPGPFYLVWTGAQQRDVHRYPWPYQLTVIDRAPFESEYPHMKPPPEDAAGPAGTGYAIFRRECASCHSINGEGGKVGPDLNIPKSIVEYRPADQIRAYIRDPNTFRRTSMPPHPHLRDEDLDALLAYFAAMSRHKFDPEAASPP